MASKTYFSDAYAKYNAQRQKTQQRQSESSTSASRYQQSAQPRQNYAQSKYQEWLASRGKSDTHDESAVPLASETKNYREDTLHPLLQRQLTDLGTRGEKLYGDTARYVSSADSSRDQWDYRSYIEQVNSYMDELRRAKVKYGSSSSAADYLAALEKDFGNLSDALYGQKDLLSQLPTGVSYGVPGRAPTYEEARQNWRTARSEAQMDNKGDWSALVADAPVYGPTLPGEAEPGKSSVKEKTDEVETKLSGLKADALRRIEMNTTDKSVISAARRERARMSNEKLLDGLPEGASYALDMAGAGTLRQPTSISAGLVDTAALLTGNGEEYGNGYAALDYAAQVDPEVSALVNTLARTGGRDPKIARQISQRTGVSEDVVTNYGIHIQPEYSRQMAYDRYPQLSTETRDRIGDMAYQLGDQFVTTAFQIIGSYGYGLAPVEGNGLFNQLIRGAEGGIANADVVGGNLITGALKGAGASAKDAVKGALVGTLKMPAMWMSVASDAAFQQLRQTGYNPQAYTNGFLQGFGETFTENLFGLNGTALDDMLSTMSTSFGKNLAKNVINYALSGAEEGLEEIVNVPLGGLFEKMTVDADKPIFGDGGLFDVKEMWKSGVSGAEMGLILGGVSALTAVTAAKGSAVNIAEQARQLNALVDAMPEAYRPAKVTPEFTDSAAVETLRASILDGYQRYYADVAQKNQRLIQQIYHSRGEDISEADAARIMQTYTDLGYGENGISAFVALAPGGEDLNSYTYAFDRVYRAGVTGQEISEVEDLLPADEAYMVYAAGIDDSASEAVRNAVQDRLPVTEEETQETTSVPSQEAVEAPTAVQSATPSNDTAERAELRNAQEEPQKTAQNASQNKGSASLDSTDLFQFVGNVSKEGKTAISGAFEMYRQSGGEMSADSFGRSADTVYALARDLGGSQAVRGSILGSISDKRAAIALQAVFDQGAADRTVKAAPTTRKSIGTVRAATEEELTRLKITGAKVVDLNTVDNRVSAEVKALQKIGQKLGVDFVIYESVADENGVRSADNGLYDPSTNAVYLDVHAGIVSNESMLRTAGHELTHFIQRWSPEEYSKLRQLVVDRYIGKNKALLDKRVAQKVQEYRAHGIELTTDGAIDEMVADACEMMLRDPEAMSWISEQDKTLKDKIAEWIREFVQMIKDAFEGVTSLSREAKDMLDDMEDLQKAWNSGIQSAGERSSSATVELTETQKSQAESNDFGIVVQDGAAVSVPVAEIMRSPDYHPPVDPIGEAIRQSVRTRPAWAKAYLEYYGNSAEQQKVVDALNRFTDNMIMDREIMDFVPTGDYTHTTMGPIRANQEYHVTIDMDASCPRTFQFAAYRDRIQKLGNRMLTYKESINLLELMRAYGQMIPCSYCYLENKRVLLAGSYNNFFNFRQNVINAKTDAEARKLMYSYNAKKGTLSNPAQAAMERWRTTERDYNPSIEEVWSASATSRNSVLNYLDNLYSDNLIGKNSSQTKAIDQVLRHFSIDKSYKGAVAEISNFVADWFYDTIAEIPHVYQTDNDRLVKTVDQKALNLNHEALGYAKSASSARNVDKYIPYTDQIKNIPPDVKTFINAMGGIRKHSSNDFRLDYVQDYFMIFADLAAEGYFGHTYTKNIDYAKIFGRTGDRINMSIAMVDNKDGTVGMNLQEGADWNEVKSLVENYPDVGAMAMVTSNNQLAFALNSDWITMIIPFHASSLDKAVWYNLRAWFDYTSKQNERPYNASDMKKALRSRNIPFPKNAKSQQIKEIFEAEFKPKHLYKEDGTVARPHFFPDDTIVNGQVVPGHHNDAKRYFELCREYAVHPRFDGIMIPDGNGGEMNVIDHPGYVKLIKETSRTDTEQRAIQFNFDEYDPYLKMTPFEYAMQRMKEEAKNGGYGNVQQDAFGIVDEFMSEYFGKNRPIGYLTERAKNAAEVMEEMREDQLKFDVSGNEVRHSARNIEAERTTVSETEPAYLDEVVNNQHSARITDPDLLSRLKAEFSRGEYDPVKNPDGGYIKLYRSVQIIDGGMYAPMNAVDRDEDGKNHRLGFRSEFGQFEMATESIEIAQRYMDAHPGAKYAKFDLDGVDNKTSSVAYNPYIHVSNVVLNDQFAAAYRRNLITVECWVPVSEDGAYWAKYAKDGTGWANWKVAPLATELGKLKPQYKRRLFVSRYALPVREVPASEVAEMYAEYLSGTNLSVPWNVVTPELRRELVKVGVRIDYKDVYQSTDKETGEKRYLKFSDAFPEERDEANTSHSIRDTEQADLARENRSLQAKVRSLQKQLAAAKAQTKLSDREAVREADLNRLASVYIREYGLKMKRADLVEQIRGIASAVVRDPAWESAVNAAEPVARSIVSQLNGDAEDVEQAVEELRNILIEDVTNNIRYVPKTFADRQAEKVSSLRQELKEANSEINKRIREIDKLEKKLTEAERRSLASDMAKGTQLYEERKEAEATIKDLSSWIKKQEKKIARLEREITEAERRSLSAEEAHKKALARVTQKYESLQQRRHQQVLSERKKKILNAVKGRVKELDQMVRSPSDKSHVPEYLKKTAIEIVSWFAPESEIFGRGKKTSGAPPVPETALARTGEDNFADDPTIDFDAVGKVIYAYEKLISDEEVNYADIVDPDVTGMLQHIQETLSNNYANGSHLSDLPYEDISDIKTILDNLYHIIKHGNAVFLNGRRVNAFELASLLTDDMMQRGTHTSNFLTRTQLAQFISKGNITPYYFFKNAGGVLNDLYGNLMEGQRAYGREIIKAKKRVRQIMEKYHYDQWSEANKPAGKKTRIQFTTENGDELNVTLEEALSLYATHKRETANVEQESKHLSAGGFVTESAVRSEKKGGKIIGIEFDDTRPIKLTFNDTVKLASMLTEEQRQYADEMVSYISKDMSDLGNEVSMKLYGYKKFLEKYYFPYETQSEYKAIRLDQPDTVSQIKNVSFSKKTVKGAASPLVIRGFTDTVLGHIAGMVNYYSEAIPQDTMMRVLNFKFRREEAEAMDTEYGTRAPRNVQTAITNAMGMESLQYITQLMRDMFNGPHNGGDILGRMLSSFKKSAVMASLSVTIQQPSSIARALALLAPKYFAVKSPTKSTWDELLRYSGTAAIKDIGSFDVATSRSTARWLAEPDNLRAQMKTGKVLDTIDDIASYGPEMMDRITWLRIWSAVKAETKAKYPNYTTEQMLAEAGKRFDEVINATQVYDSVLSKSQMMRQKDFGSKMVTSFMAEPTVAYNLLVDAFRKGQSGRHRAKALGSFVAAGVLNAILKSFVQALRKSGDKDRDYIERYAAELASNLAGAPLKIGKKRIYVVGSELSPLTMLPVIRDIIEIMQGYEVERSDMSPVSDVYKSVQKALSDTTTAEDVIQNVVTVVSYLTGVPAKNVYRDVEAIVRECLNHHNAEKDRTWQSIMDSITAEMGVFGSKAEQYDSIVSDWIEGNDAEKTVARLQRGGADEKTVKSGIVSAVKRAYTAGEIDTSTAEEFLKRASVDGTGTNSPAGKIASWGLDEDETIYDELFSAFDSGEDVSGMAAEIAGKYGLEEDAVYGKIRTHIKERYLDGEIDDETAEALLVASGKDPEKTGAQSVSATVDLWSAGEDASIYDTLWTVMADGKGVRAEISRLRKEYSSTDSSMKSAITSHYKEEYIASSAERRTQIRQEIYSTGLYSSADAVRDLCRGWLKK